VFFDCNTIFSAFRPIFASDFYRLIAVNRILIPIFAKILLFMELSLKQLAELTNGRVEGDESLKVHTFAKIEEALPGSLTFLANPKYTHFIYNTKATAVLVADSFEPEEPVPAALIRVKDPYTTLAELMGMVSRLTAPADPVGIEQPVRVPDNFVAEENIYIGAFSYIADDVKIGKDSKIYPQSFIGRGVEIGECTTIYPGVKIYPGCKIGSRCIIHSGAVIGADGFGFAPKDGIYEKIPQIGAVEIADDVEIGANTTIDSATMGMTRIGKGTKIDNLVQVAHNVIIGNNNAFAAQTGIAGSTRIGDNNIVAGQVGFAGHIKVGNNNVIGAQSGIPNDVGNENRLLGYPAVDARQFAKNLVYIKKLEELFKCQNKN